MQNNFRKYNKTVQIISASGTVIVVQNCAGYMFTNIGDTICRVDGMVIFPSSTPASALGDSRTIMLHEGDLYKGTILVSFNNPAGVNPLIELVQLFYVV